MLQCKVQPVRKVSPVVVDVQSNTEHAFRVGRKCVPRILNMSPSLRVKTPCSISYYNVCTWCCPIRRQIIHISIFTWFIYILILRFHPRATIFTELCS